jgi:glycosyltransferase involved in cell wall biosynthesis
MKIIIVGTAYPLRGGIAHYIALLYRNLKLRHSVEIISFRRQYPKLLFPGKTQEDTGEESIPVESEQILDSINPLNWIRVALRIRNKHPDLVIFKYWMPFFAPCFGTIAALSRWRTKTKVLFICDNVIPHERRFGDRFLTKSAFKFVDYFVVQSNAVEKDLTAFYPKANFKHLPHPVYDIFGQGISKLDAKSRLNIDAEKVILFFGYVRAYKGLHVLIEAMPEILRRTKVKLVVVGEFYDDEEKYQSRIRDLGLQDDVVVISNYVSNNEVGLYFSAADVVVLPYISATQSGIVQIAYNFDKPVIATDVGGLAEVVIDGTTGFIVPPQNPTAIADAVIRFYTEMREREFVGNIKVEKQKYSWEKFVEGIESFEFRV